MEGRAIEDLTLAQLAQLFVLRPARTWKAWKTYVADPDTDALILVDQRSKKVAMQLRWAVGTIALSRIQLLLFGIAVAVGWHGNMILRGTKHRPSPDGEELALGTPLLWLAIAIWLLGEVIGNWTQIQHWWKRKDRLSRRSSFMRVIPALVWISACISIKEAMAATGEIVLPLLQDAAVKLVIGIIMWWFIDIAENNKTKRKHKSASGSNALSDAKNNVMLEATRIWARRAFRHYFRLSRVVPALSAIAASSAVWSNTANNTFEPPIIALWLVSGLLWAWAFAPANWNLFHWAADKVDAVRRFRWREYQWVALALVFVFLAGACFRLANLDGLPKEMYPDHGDAKFDAYRIKPGNYEIMQAPRHDAREPLQYYLSPLFSNLPGLGIKHHTLKLAAAIESILTLPLLFWVCAEIMGERSRRFGPVVGLLMAGLVAVSFWHVVISRYALRPHLTAPFAALVLIFLARAVGHSRRSDFVACGLAVGFSLYAYAASRMLPLAVVAAVAITLVIRGHSWHERMRYFINLAVLAFASFMIFLPMLHYAKADPEHFWSQVAIHTSGNSTIDENTQGIFSVDTLGLLLNNVRNSLLAFNWQGDRDWIHPVIREPAMDAFASTFLVLGAAALATRILKWRDPAHWMLPFAFVCMLLPSALALYLPWVNPDNTRMSGAIPAAYAIAALPIAIIAVSVTTQISGREGRLVAVPFCGIVLLLSIQRNLQVYFHDFADSYANHTRPYTEMGAVLRGFDESDGAYANAFVIGWGFFRLVAIESGASDPEVAHRNMRLYEVPGYIRSSMTKSEPFRFMADRDLLLFFDPENEETSTKLADWFPNGSELQVTAYDGKAYNLYRVPALGEAGISEFLNANG